MRNTRVKKIKINDRLNCYIGLTMKEGMEITDLQVWLLLAMHMNPHERFFEATSFRAPEMIETT